MNNKQLIIDGIIKFGKTHGVDIIAFRHNLHGIYTVAYTMGNEYVYTTCVHNLKDITHSLVSDIDKINRNEHYMCHDKVNKSYYLSAIIQHNDNLMVNKYESKHMKTNRGCD